MWFWICLDLVWIFKRFHHYNRKYNTNNLYLQFYSFINCMIYVFYCAKVCISVNYSKYGDIGFKHDYTYSWWKTTCTQYIHSYYFYDIVMFFFIFSIVIETTLYCCCYLHCTLFFMLFKTSYQMKYGVCNYPDTKQLLLLHQV